jgi:hypothetical protein
MHLYVMLMLLQRSSPIMIAYTYVRLYIIPVNDDDVHFKKITTKGVTKSDPTQKCRPTKGISK